MLYRVIGLMSGSSLDGLDIVFAELQENNGQWNFEIVASDCYAYQTAWKEKLRHAITLDALHYQLLHADYGHYIGQQVNRFIEEKNLHYKVALIASHGHTSFHLPEKKMTAQLGDGAAIAAETKLPVVTDLRAMDIAFGGQGAPIVPIGEKLLFPGYDFFLNLGGIANLSIASQEKYIAFDVCPANQVLNLLSAFDNKEYDDGGQMASMGNVHEGALQKLNALDYYKRPCPKSLANHFGTEEIFSLIESFGLTHNDALRTYVEHIVIQIKEAIRQYGQPSSINRQLLVTGGGAFNTFLMQRLSEKLAALNIEAIIPDAQIVQYKEALVMALIGVLRWRQEYNVLSSVTGAERNSIGGAVWIGQEA